MTRIAMLAVLVCLVMFGGLGCSSRPKSTAEDRLYYNYGGDTLRRKRTEVHTANVTRSVRNAATGRIERVTTQESRTVIMLEIERADGTIIDHEVPLDLANKLREGQPIPYLSDERAAAAGIVGNCVLVNNVVIGGAAHGAGIMEDDLILEYNGQKALGVKKLYDLAGETVPEETVKIIIERDGTHMQLDVAGGPLGVEVEDEWK